MVFCHGDYKNSIVPSYSASLYTGGMTSGKTFRIMKIISDATLQGRLVEVMAYPVHENKIVSRTGLAYPAFTSKFVEEMEDRLEKLDPFPNIVIFDDAQLLERVKFKKLFLKCKKLAKVVVSAIQNDLFGRPFETIQEIFPHCESVINLPAICSICKKKNAIYTQRYKDLEKTIPFLDPVEWELVSDELKVDKRYYDPVCFGHFQTLFL